MRENRIAADPTLGPRAAPNGGADAQWLLLFPRRVGQPYPLVGCKSPFRFALFRRLPGDRTICGTTVGSKNSKARLIRAIRSLRKSLRPTLCGLSFGFCLERPKISPLTSFGIFLLAEQSEPALDASDCHFISFQKDQPNNNAAAMLISQGHAGRSIHRKACSGARYTSGGLIAIEVTFDVYAL